MNQEITELQDGIKNDLIKMKHKAEPFMGIEQKNKFDEQIKKIESMDMSIR